MKGKSFLWLLPSHIQFDAQIGFEKSNLLRKCMKYDKGKPTQENRGIRLEWFNLCGHWPCNCNEQIEKMSRFEVLWTSLNAQGMIRRKRTTLAIYFVRLTRKKETKGKIFSPPPPPCSEEIIFEFCPDKLINMRTFHKDCASNWLMHIYATLFIAFQTLQISFINPISNQSRSTLGTFGFA